MKLHPNFRALLEILTESEGEDSNSLESFISQVRFLLFFSAAYIANKKQ